MKPIIATLCIALALAGCGGGDAPPAAASTSYLLKSDLADAVPVKAALASEAGNEVALFGRVQQLNRDGRAIFFVVDEEVPYCGKGKKSCGCKTPWDYCCVPDEMKAGRIAVELRDEKGMPAKADDLGLRLLDLIAVKGTLEKTAEGGLVLVADNGWYRRERPEIPEGVKWPK